MVPSSLPVSRSATQSYSRLGHRQVTRRSTCITTSVRPQLVRRPKNKSFGFVQNSSQRIRFNSRRLLLDSQQSVKRRTSTVIHNCTGMSYAYGLRLSYSSSQDAVWICLSSWMSTTKAAASKPHMHAPHLHSVTPTNPGLYMQPIARKMDINGRSSSMMALPGHRTKDAFETSYDTVAPQPHVYAH